MRTIILVPDNAKGLLGLLYTYAMEAIKGFDAFITTNWRRAIRESKNINRVIIIMGSKGKGACETYALLKEARPELKFVIINGFKVKVRKKDKMVLFDGLGLQKIIQESF